jgi:four helix bundle protein
LATGYSKSELHKKWNLIMRDFRKLEIWRKAIELTKEIYVISDSFPEKEKFGLVSQIRRAAVSVPSNIAEGTSRRSHPDFIRLLEIALGSAFEVETQLILAKEIGYIEDCRFAKCLEELTILQKQINQLVTSIRKAL